MLTFIKCERLMNTPVWINVDKVVWIEECISANADKCSLIKMSNGLQVKVISPPFEVIKLMNQHITDDSFNK